MKIKLERLNNSEEISRFSELANLVDEVQSGEPYFDDPGAFRAADWLPRACEDACVILLAQNEKGILGYCLAQPFTSYGNFQSSPADYGIDPEKCLYLSELGVSQTARGMGVGTMLVNALRQGMESPFSEILVRTLRRVHGTDQVNPAINFYESLDFTIVRQGDEPLIETLRDRPRVFLRWSASE